MRKKLSLLLVMAMVFSMIGCSGETEQKESLKAEASNQEQSEKPREAILLRWGDAAVEGTAEYEANQKFIQLVEEYTQGDVRIDYFPAGQLGADGDVVQACMANTLELGKCSTANLSEFTDILDFCDFPGMFRDTDHVYEVLSSELRDELAMQVYQEIGCYPITFDVDGGTARWMFNSKRDVKIPKDAYNLKIRTTGSDIEMALYGAWGIGATPMSWQELYTGIEQGTVDGVYAGPVPAFTNNFTEVAKHATILTLSFGPSVRLMSQQAIDSLGGLDGELFKAVLKASKESEQIKRQLNEVDVAEVADKMREQGVIIYEPTEEENLLWLESSRQIVPQFIGEEKTISQELYDKVQTIGQ